MSSTLLAKLKALLKMLKLVASYTATTVDDKLVALLETAIDNPAVQAVIDAVLQGMQTNPEASINSIYGAVSPENRAAAEEACGKIGDGKLLELLNTVLPLLLKLLPLVA